MLSVNVSLDTLLYTSALELSAAELPAGALPLASASGAWWVFRVSSMRWTLYRFGWWTHERDEARDPREPWRERDRGQTPDRPITDNR